MMRWSAIGAVAWTLALIGLLSIVGANAHRAEDYQRTHGYLQINEEQTVCINHDLCPDFRAKHSETYGN